MFPITKNTSKPASTPSHSKKRRFYDLESDEESSNAADLDSGIVTRSRGNSLLRRRAIENETASPSTTVVVAKQSGKKKGFLSMPVEVKYLLYSFLAEIAPVYCMINPLNGTACHYIVFDRWMFYPTQRPFA
jgi:hypothetical protein